MGNCLYTQLKATVNNSELFKLNELRFKVEGNTSNTFQLEVGYGGTTPYTVESDGVTWNASTHIITGESGTISLFPKISGTFSHTPLNSTLSSRPRVEQYVLIRSPSRLSPPPTIQRR